MFFVCIFKSTAKKKVFNQIIILFFLLCFKLESTNKYARVCITIGGKKLMKVILSKARPFIYFNYLKKEKKKQVFLCNESSFANSHGIFGLCKRDNCKYILLEEDIKK